MRRRVAGIPGRAAQVVENLLAEILGYQGPEGTHGEVAEEVQVVNFLRKSVQFLAGAETLYLSPEDLAKGHVP
jgi:hypothetical protein